MARSPTDTIRFLTLEELARLFAVVRASPRNRALFLIAYRHGLRASEVGLLRTDDLDFRALRIMVHRLKGSHSGAHPMQPDEAKALRTASPPRFTGGSPWRCATGSMLCCDRPRWRLRRMTMSSPRHPAPALC
jgi:integrase